MARSLGFAALTVLLCLILCYPVAFWVARLPQRARLFCLFLVTLPFFSSLIGAPLEILYTQSAVVLGLVYVMVPFMFLPLYAAVDNLDRAQVEASMDLGANRVQTFLKVVLPQTMPGIMGGAVIVFIPSVGNFIVPDILGGAKGLMIGNLVEQQFLSSRNWPFGSALSMVIMSVVLTVLLVAVTRAKKTGAGHA